MNSARVSKLINASGVSIRSNASASTIVDFIQLSRTRLIICVLVLGVGAIAECVRATAPTSRPQTTLLQNQPLSANKFAGLRLIERSVLPNPVGAPSAHASTLTQLPNGELLVLWWAGSRESGPDVSLYSARRTNGRWSEAREVMNRQTLGDGLGFRVRRIGNPVVWTAANGQTHLFVVATGLGGWAASRIVHLVSADAAKTFSVRRILPLTPLLNTSVLVRNNPIAQADNGWLLPAYFELSNKYPFVISFDANGNLRWISRIGRARTTLQPALLTRSPNEVHAFMRDAGPERRVRQAVSYDAGRNWRDLPALSVSNQNNSLAVHKLTDDADLMIHNVDPSGEGSRQRLQVSTLINSRWESLLNVQYGSTREEYSYPSLLQVGSELHVTFTFNRQTIAHHVYEVEYKESDP